jgi:hypothetical protein
MAPTALLCLPVMQLQRREVPVGPPRRSDSMPPDAMPAQSPPLSRFEGHCLSQRTRECELLLQLAVLGVAQAIERHCPDDDLADVAHHLREAERHVEIARQLAARWSE